ncbi:flagellar filament capping protein FliD [Pseudobacillus sp. FSL P4-0506]|uniref:flagellar filament capping protein FliD n=1 Tax=Pseudobacillus sp. FSL P4-0506 TaxID=2921576 RepID=UPI0030F9AC50
MAMRISGLASGMDTESIVKDLMKAERMPLDKLKQKRQLLQWQRDDYRAMNTLLLDFRSELTKMKLSSTYRSRTTSSTNEALVSAVASSGAEKASHTVSSVRQLAGSERILNGGSVTLDPAKGLFGQSSVPDATWRQGAIETKSIVADGVTKDFSVGVPAENLQDFSSWSVKVNGKGYKVVDSATWNDATINNDNNVFIDTNGVVHFKQNVAQDSSVRIDYIAKTKTDTATLAYNSKSIQLSKGSVDTVSSFVLKKDGAVAQAYDVDANGNVFKKDSTDQVGTLDKQTGKVSFIDGKIDLPPNPEDLPAGTEGPKFTMEVTYNQNYTTFSLDTSTSKGAMHENFLVQGNESINQLSNRVNGSNVGVTLFYDQQSGKMTLNRTETGKFASSGNDIVTNGSLINDVFKFGSNTTVTSGQDAILTINGVDTTRKSNTFEMNGVTFTLKQTFNTDPSNPTTTPVGVNINNDSTQVFDNIVKFVNKYNELIDKIQKKTGEEKYRSYAPLTDEQRESLSDKQQEQWEEKAKSGLLRRDPILSSVLSDMRMDFYQPVSNDNVSGLYNQLSKIGITTTNDYTSGGKLTIDETKLKKALEEDPQSVESLFTGEGATEAQQGIIHRLYDSVSKTMNKINDKAGASYYTTKMYSMGQQLDDMENRIDRFEDRMKQVEDRYWRQFTAMEKAIQRANAQSAQMLQSFGG